MIEVEICINCDSHQDIEDSVGAAYNGGAERIELCGAMHVDGLTPQKDQIVSARKAFKDRPGLMVMIRPRGGDFNYSSKEVDQMIHQIRTAAESGANGIVIGPLRAEDNYPDTDVLDKLIQTSAEYDLLVTFNRAFDATPNPLKAIEILIDLGIDKILTSGTRWGEQQTAEDGINQLKQIIEVSQSRIEIVIGGGININNVDNILRNLTLRGNKISVHSYSGVQENGTTKLESVKLLVDKIKNIESLV